MIDTRVTRNCSGTVRPCPSSPDTLQEALANLRASSNVSFPSDTPSGFAFVPVVTAHLPELCDSTEYVTGDAHSLAKPVSVAQLASGRFVLGRWVGPRRATRGALESALSLRRHLGPFCLASALVEPSRFAAEMKLQS